jgi:hypothetical protein
MNGKGKGCRVSRVGCKGKPQHTYQIFSPQKQEKLCLKTKTKPSRPSSDGSSIIHNKSIFPFHRDRIMFNKENCFSSGFAVCGGLRYTTGERMESNSTISRGRKEGNGDREVRTSASLSCSCTQCAYKWFRYCVWHKLQTQTHLGDIQELSSCSMWFLIFLSSKRDIISAWITNNNRETFQIDRKTSKKLAEDEASTFLAAKSSKQSHVAVNFSFGREKWKFYF